MTTSGNSQYNATVYRCQPDGTVYSTFVAAATADGVILRSNAAQFTGREDSPMYDVYLRNVVMRGYDLRVVLDNGEGYRRALRGLILPDTYRENAGH